VHEWARTGSGLPHLGSALGGVAALIGSSHDRAARRTSAPSNQDPLDLIKADLVVAAVIELGRAGRALMGLLRLRSWRGLRRLLAPLDDTARLTLLWRRSHKLLVCSGQLRLHVG